MIKKIKIGNRIISANTPSYIIAEIGSNHDGNIEQAKELIRKSAEIGADAVKFQSFSAEGLLNPLKLENKKWVHHPAYPIINKLELPDAWHKKLKKYAEDHGVEFLSAPFDFNKARLLKSLRLNAYKIASGDLTNEPIIQLICSFNKPVILSTGASYMKEVEHAVSLLKKYGCKEYGLLHCVSNYPPRFEDANIKAIVTLKNKFKCPVGYSDHTPGIIIPLAAVTLGSTIIEKHITLSRKQNGPDHPYAMEVNEFGEMIRAIRILEKAMGDGIKKPVKSEMCERIGARRSIYAAQHISKGEKFSDANIKLVRHAYGLTPDKYFNVLGKKAKHVFKKDELIEI